MAVFNVPSYVDIFQTTARARLAHATNGAKSIHIQKNFADDDIEIGIVYRLLYGGELLDGPRLVEEKFARRLNELLQIKSKTPKQLSVERRRMLWRGEVARKAKAKKV